MATTLSGPSPWMEHMDASCASPYTYAYAIMYSDTVMIPSGCDSVVFNMEQDLERTCSGVGWSAAEVHFRTNGETWIEIYDGPWQSTDPIHSQISVFQGDILDFRIQGLAQAGSDIHPGSGDIEWLIWDLTLTFYGYEVDLQQVTWSSIKALGR
jgi:hypothetical protein